MLLLLLLLLLVQTPHGGDDGVSVGGDVGVSAVVVGPGVGGRGGGDVGTGVVGDSDGPGGGCSVRNDPAACVPAPMES